MTDNVLTRRILRKAIGFAILPLAAAGCQHTHHVATTQVVVQISPDHTAIAEVAAPEPVAPPPAPAPAPAVAPPTTQAAPEPSHETAQGSSGAGHGVGQVSRETGHTVAQASRQTYHATANGVRAVGSSVADLTTNSVQGMRNTKPESLSAPVIVVDEAMQARDWDQVPAVYSSGATVAGTTGFLYEPKTGQPLWHYGVIETPLFFVNTALLPFAFAKTPPWAPVEWKAATVEPTYTAVPPLPPLP